MDCTGMMGSMTNVLLKMAKEQADWFWQQNSHVWLLTQSACDQYLSLVLPGRMFKEAFEDRRLAP